MLDLSRRNALRYLTVLPFLAGMIAGARPATAQTVQAPSSRKLVAFFSRTGNTRVIVACPHRVVRVHS